MRPIPECRPQFFCAHIPYAVHQAEIPNEFWNSLNPYHRAVMAWFYYGGERLMRGEDGVLLSLRDRVREQEFWLAPKAELSEAEAKRAVYAIGNILASFDFQHEHKLAMAAYLASEWFDLIQKEEEDESMDD
jgi:hypothetical protein